MRNLNDIIKQWLRPGWSHTLQKRESIEIQQKKCSLTFLSFNQKISKITQNSLKIYTFRQKKKNYKKMISTQVI